jgi:hypothetical protein
MAAAIWSFHTTAMEWEETMIRPEIQILRYYEWNHMTLSGDLCANNTVALINVLNSSSKEVIETQLVCHKCMRSLIIYGKEN